MRRHGSIRKLLSVTQMQQRGRHTSLEPIPCRLPPRNQGAPMLRHCVPYMCQSALLAEKTTLYTHAHQVHVHAQAGAHAF